MSSSSVFSDTSHTTGTGSSGIGTSDEDLFQSSVHRQKRRLETSATGSDSAGSTSTSTGVINIWSFPYKWVETPSTMNVCLPSFWNSHYRNHLEGHFVVQAPDITCDQAATSTRNKRFGLLGIRRMGYWDGNRADCNIIWSRMDANTRIIQFFSTNLDVLRSLVREGCTLWPNAFEDALYPIGRHYHHNGKKPKMPESVSTLALASSSSATKMALDQSVAGTGSLTGSSSSTSDGFVEWDIDPPEADQGRLLLEHHEHGNEESDGTDTEGVADGALIESNASNGDDEAMIDDDDRDAETAEDRITLELELRNQSRANALVGHFNTFTHKLVDWPPRFECTGTDETPICAD